MPFSPPSGGDPAVPLTPGQRAEEPRPARVEVVAAFAAHRIPARVIDGNGRHDRRADDRELQVADDDGKQHI